ncbi:unnamed protein product [Dovyalis caffra]|uniref:Uncharacterized protein n=1 Tax=Dovyalis caffra TaxID=77055 RepID=A0AAV1SAC7_9ROSI|nr:unnamed protein product [Dovyalis caffra]
MAGEHADQRFLRHEHQMESLCRQTTKILQAFQIKEESSTNHRSQVARTQPGTSEELKEPEGLITVEIGSVVIQGFIDYFCSAGKCKSDNSRAPENA